MISPATRVMTCTLTIALLLGLSACGVRRPLIAPKDIPAYEAAQERRRARLLGEEAPAPAPTAAANPQTPAAPEAQAAPNAP